MDDMALNVFQEKEIRVAARIVEKLTGYEGIVCTLACRGRLFYFRVFKGSVDNINWTALGNESIEDGDNSFVSGRIAWASPSRVCSKEVIKLVEVVGAGKDALLSACTYFLQGSRGRKRGIVWYWQKEREVEV